MSSDEHFCLRLIYSGRNTAISVISYWSFSTGPSIHLKSLSGLASISMCSLSSADIDIFDWQGFPFFWLPHSFHHTCFGCSRRKSTLCFCFFLRPLLARGFRCLVVRLIFLNSAVIASASTLKFLLPEKFVTVWHRRVFFNGFETLISKLLKYHFPSTSFWEFEVLLYMNNLCISA